MALGREPYLRMEVSWGALTLSIFQIGQNGALAVLAYAYCHQWEYPPARSAPQKVPIVLCVQSRAA